MGKTADGEMTAAKRIDPERCCAAIVDLQGFFLSQIEPRLRTRVKTNTANLARLIGAFGIPVVVTLERPLDIKGTLPKEVARRLGPRAKTFEKDFFDLTKDKRIKAHLARLKRRQVIVAGCETDVCVMQSCLGLIALGYEVYVMEEMIFSSARDVDAARARMNDAGCVFITNKMLYYELIASVEGPGARFDAFGPFPEDLPDAAV
jgi:nicotinamidase-related amidase